MIGAISPKLSVLRKITMSRKYRQSGLVEWVKIGTKINFVSQLNFMCTKINTSKASPPWQINWIAGCRRRWRPVDSQAHLWKLDLRHGSLRSWKVASIWLRRGETLWGVRQCGWSATDCCVSSRLPDIILLYLANIQISRRNWTQSPTISSQNISVVTLESNSYTDVWENKRFRLKFFYIMKKKKFSLHHLHLLNNNNHFFRLLKNFFKRYYVNITSMSFHDSYIYYLPRINVGQTAKCNFINF